MAQGKDCGADAIRFALARVGFEPMPSRSSVNRILEREQLVQHNSKKRPKSSNRRFNADFPNQRWQADGMKYRLATGLETVIIEIIDDATRFHIAAHPGRSESSATVLEAFAGAIETYGRPVLVHTDNGAAFNTERFGNITMLQGYLNDLGIKMITGRPGHPQSQGKVERAHASLRKFLDARVINTMDELREVLEEYREYYNENRGHEHLPPGVTPGEQYRSLPKVAPPHEPIHPRSRPNKSSPQHRQHSTVKSHKAGRSGRIKVRYDQTCAYTLGNAFNGETVMVTKHTDHLELFDGSGTQIAATPWPPARLNVGLAKQIATKPVTGNCPLCPEP